MQVDPIRPTLKPPGTNSLIPECDALVSSYGFIFNLRRYIKAQQLSGGWWDGTIAGTGSGSSSGGPQLELQAVNDTSRARLLRVVHATLVGPGPARCCLPSHPTLLKHSFIEIPASCDVANKTCQAIHGGGSVRDVRAGSGGRGDGGARPPRRRGGDRHKGVAHGGRRCHQQGVPGRGLHSSTFRLNVSAFCGIRGACWGCLGGDQDVSGGMRGCLGCILCQKRLRLS